MNETKSTRGVMLRVIFAAVLVLLFAAAGVGAVSAADASYDLAIGNVKITSLSGDGVLTISQSNSGTATANYVQVTVTDGTPTIKLDHLNCEGYGYNTYPVHSTAAIVEINVVGGNPKIILDTIYPHGILAEET